MSQKFVSRSLAFSTIGRSLPFPGLFSFKVQPVSEYHRMRGSYRLYPRSSSSAERSTDAMSGGSHKIGGVILQSEYVN